MARQTRINARLDPALARKVAAVQRRTKKSLTEIVEASLERFCDAELAEPGRALRTLERVGFIGCGEGPADLSARYKDEYRALLDRKA